MSSGLPADLPSSLGALRVPVPQDLGTPLSPPHCGFCSFLDADPIPAADYLPGDHRQPVHCHRCPEPHLLQPLHLSRRDSQGLPRASARSALTLTESSVSLPSSLSFTLSSSPCPSRPPRVGLPSPGLDNCSGLLLQSLPHTTARCPFSPSLCKNAWSLLLPCRTACPHLVGSQPSLGCLPAQVCWEGCPGPLQHTASVQLYVWDPLELSLYLACWPQLDHQLQDGGCAGGLSKQSWDACENL